MRWKQRPNWTVCLIDESTVRTLHGVAPPSERPPHWANDQPTQRNICRHVNDDERAVSDIKHQHTDTHTETDRQTDRHTRPLRGHGCVCV